MKAKKCSRMKKSLLIILCIVVTVTFASCGTSERALGGVARTLCSQVRPGVALPGYGLDGITPGYDDGSVPADTAGEAFTEPSGGTSSGETVSVPSAPPAPSEEGSPSAQDEEGPDIQLPIGP